MPKAHEEEKVTQAQDIEAVNSKIKEMRDATGVHPEMAIVARELARERREWKDRAKAAEMRLQMYEGISRP